MWAETNFFGFHSPEEGLNGHVYCLFRPNQGVCLTTVALNSRRCATHWEADYLDMSTHVPMSTDFDLRRYSLNSGVSVRCLQPTMSYEVNYDDDNGTRVHFRYDALMPGFDIHDPNMDPMVAAQAEGSDYAWGTAYNGHYDQTGVCEGEIALRGRTIPFRCVATRDHSWGPRPGAAPDHAEPAQRRVHQWPGAGGGDVDLAVHAMCATSTPRPAGPTSASPTGTPSWRGSSWAAGWHLGIGFGYGPSPLLSPPRLLAHLMQRA